MTTAITKSGCKYYRSPSEGARDFIPEGTTIIIAKISGGWYQIAQDDGRWGGFWVDANYVTIIEPEPNPDPDPEPEPEPEPEDPVEYVTVTLHRQSGKTEVLKCLQASPE